MPQVSKKKLKRETLLRIHEQFADTLLNLRNTKLGKEFIAELFTSTEKIMFAKRFAIIVLLSEGYSSYRIHKNLGVSISTVLRMRKGLNSDTYKEIIKVVQSKKNRERLQAELEVLLRLGMPSMGKGRWKWTYQHTAHLSKKSK